MLETAAAAARDPEKEAREAEERGSDEEDSGPDAEGEADVDVEDLVVLEAGGLEEQSARAKAAAMAIAKTRCLSNGAPPEAKGKVRRLWDCVSLFFLIPLPSLPFLRPCPCLCFLPPSRSAR